MVVEGTNCRTLQFKCRFWVSGMSKKSKDFRSKAARELRASRNGGTPAEKGENKKRAAALKSLAENEEWLEGERRRSRKDIRQTGRQEWNLPKRRKEFPDRSLATFTSRAIRPYAVMRDGRTLGATDRAAK